MTTRTELTASDLFVVLEKAFRRKAPECCGCTFTIPYPQQHRGDPRNDWAVLLTQNCSPRCRTVLEEIVTRARREYQLAE